MNWRRWNTREEMLCDTLPSPFKQVRQNARQPCRFL